MEESKKIKEEEASNWTADDTAWYDWSHGRRSEVE